MWFEMITPSPKNRRMEVAWIGYRESEGGWFFRLRSKGKALIDFSQPNGSETGPTLKAPDLPSEFLADSSSGAESFGRLCEYFGIAPQQRSIKAAENRFQITGLRGRPVKTGLIGYVLYHGPEISEKENPTADRLAKAVERYDAEAIRRAVAEGASLEHLPGRSISPLLAVLFKCPQSGWEACAELLIELGSPVNGWPDSEPPLVAASQHFLEEGLSLAILEFLVQRGANVNAPGIDGDLALFNAVVHRRKSTIQFLLEHGADPHAKTGDGKTIIDWVKSRIENDHRRGFCRYAEILTLLTGEEVQQPGLLQLTDELKRENQRFEEALQARNLLKMLSSKSKIARIPHEVLHDYHNFKSLSQELEACGFLKAGSFEIHLGQVLLFATAFVNEELGFDALLTPSEGQRSRLRLEIGATLTNGHFVSVANEKASQLLNFKSSNSNCETVSGASVRELTDRLQQRIQSQHLKAQPVDVATFAERTADFNQRLIAEIREYLTNLLETPVILDNGQPARFERLRCFLDLHSKSNPTWSTAKVAESLFEDLEEAEAAEPNDSWRLEQGIIAAAGLLAMQRLQFAGAPSGDDFIHRGAAVAVRYFEAESRRSKPFANHWCVDELLQGLLLNMVSDHWDAVSRICTVLKPALATSEARMNDDPPRELAKFLLILASHFRDKLIRGTAALVEDIRKSRRKHCQLLLEVWEAIQAKDPTSYERTLEESLKYAEEQSPVATNFYELRRFLAWPESVLLLAAEREGFSQPPLPERLSDRLVIMPE